MPFPWFKSRRQAQLDRIEGRLIRLDQRSIQEFTNIERHQSMADHTLDDILADTTAERSDIDALATLAAGIKTQLDQALSGATLTPAQQARVNAIFTNIEANKDALAAAILANTPSSPPVDVPTAPPQTPPVVARPPAEPAPVATEPEPVIEPTPIPTGAPVTTPVT